jgi:hypothetical protein
MISRVSFEFIHHIEQNDGEIALNVKGSYYSDPGRCSGPPDLCYPPESDLDFAVTYKGENFELTADQVSSLEETIREYIADNCDEEYPDFEPDNDYDF